MKKKKTEIVGVLPYAAVGRRGYPEQYCPACKTHIGYTYCCVKCVCRVGKVTGWFPHTPVFNVAWRGKKPGWRKVLRWLELQA